MSTSGTAANASALHLLNVSHTTAFSPLNRRYTALFLNHVKQTDLLLPDQFESQRFCSKCGVKYVPGVNVHIRVVFRKKGGISNRLRYTCNSCSAQNLLDLPPPSKVTKNKDPGEPATSKARQRAKKRNSALSSMLANKREESKKPSLDLMKFMK